MAVTGRTRSIPGQFRAIWLAELTSVLGDQLAKVAVTVLVYRATGSAAWSGLAYALLLLPPLITGPWLSGLGDRLDRRLVMVGCCLLQAALVSVMIIPGVGLAATAIAVALVSVLATPFKAAQGALLLDLFGAAGNMTANSRLATVRETGQLLGLGGAAAVVAAVGITPALLLDVLSFLAAAALLMLCLPARPLPDRPASTGAREASSLQLVLRDQRLRALAGLVLLNSLTMVPDGVVAPLTDEVGAPAWTVGLLLGADCLGVVGGNLWVARRAPEQQAALIAPMALLSLAPLAAFITRPGPVVLGLLLVISGFGAAFLSLASAQVTQRAPRHRAAAVRGVVGTGLRAGQGLAALAGGVFAQYLRSASAAIAIAGVVGVLLSAWFALSWQRTRPQAGAE